MLFAETPFGFVPMPAEGFQGNPRTALSGLSNWSRGVPAISLDHWLTSGEAALEAMRPTMSTRVGYGVGQRLVPGMGGLGLGALGPPDPRAVALGQPSRPGGLDGDFLLKLLPWLLLVALALWAWSRERARDSEPPDLVSEG